MKAVVTKTLSVLCLLTLISLESHAFRPLDEHNNPNVISTQLVTRLSQLPKSGALANKPWSDTYWSFQKGGVAQRWQMAAVDAAAVNPNNYTTLTPEQLQTASADTLAKLSPAEKYDIWMRRFTYPLVHLERRLANANTASWAGICNGIAAAASLYYEPQTTTQMVRLPNGKTIQIVFYPSDLKALLAYALITSGQMTQSLIGERCNHSEVSSSGSCWDTNPAAFFIGVTNRIGLQRKPVVMDVDANHEVWNSVIESYKAEITPSSRISSRAAPGTVKQVKVDMSISHTIGSEPRITQIGPNLKTRVYSFTLELNQNDEIIGGEWLSSRRPDFIWIPQIPAAFHDFWQTLPTLVTPLPQ